MKSHIPIIFVVLTCAVLYITSVEETNHAFIPRTIFQDDQQVLVIFKPVLAMSFPDFSTWNFLGLRNARNMQNWNFRDLSENQHNNATIGRENKAVFDSQLFGVVLQFSFPFALPIVDDYKDPETNTFQENGRSLEEFSDKIRPLTVMLPSGEELSLKSAWSQNSGKIAICKLLNSYKDKSSVVETLLTILRLIPDIVREDLENVLPEDIYVMTSAASECEKQTKTFFV